MKVVTPAIDFGFAPTSSWTLIGLIDDPHKTLVDEHGALLYGFRGRTFESWTFDRVIAIRPQITEAPARVVQRTEDPGSAVLSTRLEYENRTLVMTTFAHRDETGSRYDVVLWEYTAARPGLGGIHLDLYHRDAPLLSSGPTAGRIVIAIDPGDDDVSFWPTDNAADESARMTSEIELISTRPVSPTHTSGFRPGQGFQTEPVWMNAGEPLRGVLVVPVEGTPPSAVSWDWAERALADARSYWRAAGGDLGIVVPDQGVQDMMVAARRNILQAREIKNGLAQLQVGAAVYRGLWIVDGHFMLEAARYLGLGGAADAGLAALLRRVHDDGSITESIDVPHYKETGVALATIVRQAELTGDRKGLVARWPMVQAAARYIDWLRRRSDELPADHPLHGLMPLAFGDGGLAGERAELTTILWILVGLRYVADAAEIIGVPDKAEHRKRYDQLKEAFLERMPSLMATSPSGIKYLPMNLIAEENHIYAPGVRPSGTPVHRRVRPLTATWALCQAIWPGELFGPDHEVVRGLIALMAEADIEEGMPIETGWLPHEALWTYYASFAAHVQLYAGRPEKAVQYLYAFGNHAAPTRVWREEQSLRSASLDQICGDMPHNWASAEFVRLVTHMLAFESSGDLILLGGLPPRWRTGVRLSGHPTRFGTVDLALEQESEGASVLDFRLTGEGWVRPGAIKMRVPDGATVAEDRSTAGIQVDGHWATLPGASSIHLHWES